MSQHDHFLAGKCIVVAGAGMAGLAFVTALQKNWDAQYPKPRVIIYERDSQDAGIDRQGYSLSLSGFDVNGGLVALRDLSLLDPILEHAVLGKDGLHKFKIWASNGAELLRVRFKPHEDLPTSGIRIARQDLRRTLVEAAEAHGADIRWGVTCTSAEKMEDGRIKVQLQESDGGDRTTTRYVECDLLVAADGAASKIRASFRPDDQLEYAGAVQIAGIARFPTGLPPPVNNSWGQVMSGQGVSCFFSPVDHERVVWALSRLEEVARDIPRVFTPEYRHRVVDEALQLGAVIQEPFQTIVGATDPDSMMCFPARDKKPFPNAGSPSRVVFLGDSCHAVSPFAGNGANMALKDGWDMALALCHAKTLEAAVTMYDKASLPRAWATLKESHKRIAMCHSSGWRFAIIRLSLWVGSWIMWIWGA